MQLGECQRRKEQTWAYATGMPGRLEDSSGATVNAEMTRHAVHCGTNATIAEAIYLMIAQRVRRYSDQPTPSRQTRPESSKPD
jgi:hypothetical protein